jgi:hypothetical protein
MSAEVKKAGYRCSEQSRRQMFYLRNVDLQYSEELHVAEFEMSCAVTTEPGSS